MDVLVLGGTLFLGRHLVSQALGDGDRVTLFNRGRTAPGLFPEVEHLRGDRDGGLEALRGRRWDVVVDTCGYFPRLVGDSARLLADAAERYVFVSTISAYADTDVDRLDESSPVHRLEDPTLERLDSAERYGGLKVLCEEAAEAAMPGRAIHVRAGLIVGPHDPTDRMTWWPWRVAGGGRLIAPGPPSRPTQFIDARDLAAWMLAAARAGRAGVFNATGPQRALGQVLEGCREVAGADAAEMVWAPLEWLAERGARPWVELPLVVPEASRGMLAVDTTRAQEAGLRCRPLTQTLGDTLAWAREAGKGWPLKAGMGIEQEEGLLAQWATETEGSDA